MKPGRDRDHTFERALKHVLAVQADEPGLASEACLDAETLAAWMDDGLDPAAVVLAEAHVSNCARCQALAGAMARVAPQVPVGGDARSSFWRWWLAPVAAAVAATLMWMLVPDERSTAPPAPPGPEAAQAPSDRFVNEPQPPATPSAPPPATVSPRLTENAPRKEGTSAPATVAAEKRPGQTVPTEMAARSAKPETDAQEQRAASAQSRAFSADLTGVIQVISPDPTVRWRIRAGGAVEYTPDDGRTWERVVSGVTTEIVAGSSPAPRVCWLVGHGGLVLLSTDGRTFARVSTPVDVDLASVQASDARTVVVTTVDGRAFRTDDGGLTWRPRE